MLIYRFLVGICGRETISEKSVKNSSFEVHKKILGKDKPTRVIDFLKKKNLSSLLSAVAVLKDLLIKGTLLTTN